MKDRTRAYIKTFENYQDTMVGLKSAAVFLWPLTIIGVIFYWFFHYDADWVTWVSFLPALGLVINKWNQYQIKQKFYQDWDDIYKSGFHDTLEGEEKKELDFAIDYFVHYLNRSKQKKSLG